MHVRHLSRSGDSLEVEGGMPLHAGERTFIRTIPNVRGTLLHQTGALVGRATALTLTQQEHVLAKSAGSTILERSNDRRPMRGRSRDSHLVDLTQYGCWCSPPVAVQKLPTALIYVQALRKEVETADHTLSTANEDLGLASSDCDTRDELTGEVWAGFRRSL
ncbi:hypothetical protein B0H13DRAFT_2272966 [Mycena leptocephala]|nr:hypothetical protein B0H13DRAFT_2272966 [Mycena leptocephala]